MATLDEQKKLLSNRAGVESLKETVIHHITALNFRASLQHFDVDAAEMEEVKSHVFADFVQARITQQSLAEFLRLLQESVDSIDEANELEEGGKPSGSQENRAQSRLKPFSYRMYAHEVNLHADETAAESAEPGFCFSLDGFDMRSSELRELSVHDL